MTVVLLFLLSETRPNIYSSSSDSDSFDEFDKDVKKEKRGAKARKLESDEVCSSIFVLELIRNLTYSSAYKPYSLEGNW